MLRFRFAASAAAALALFAATPVLAQTVSEYEESLRNAQVLDTTPANADAACRPLANFADVSLPESSHANPGLLSWLPIGIVGADGQLDQKRDICRQVKSKSVVVFDDHTNTPLLTPLKLEDPNKAYGAQQVSPVGEPHL